MDELNIPVGQTQAGSVQDDAAQAAPDTQGEGSISLSELFSEGEGGAQQQETQQAQAPQTQGTDETSDRYYSGIQGRINAEVRKALTQQGAQYQASMAQMQSQVAALAEMAFSQKAAEMVAAGTFGDKETALDYLRLKGGPPPVAGEKDARPRDAQGRFTAREESPHDQAMQRAVYLKQQADDIQRSGGPDVATVFAENEQVRQMVLSGRVDFADVAKAMRQLQGREGQEDRRRVPSPVHSPNHTLASKSPLAMGDDELERIAAAARGGQRINLRR